MVGLLPLCAVTVFEGEVLAKYPELVARMRRFLEARPELTASSTIRRGKDRADRRLASILDEDEAAPRAREDARRGRVPEPVRHPVAVADTTTQHPYVFHVGEQEYRVAYLPAESDTGMFGGNSNWRGPIWMPVNGLIVRALLQYYAYYGDSFTSSAPPDPGG